MKNKQPQCQCRTQATGNPRCHLPVSKKPGHNHKYCWQHQTCIVYTQPTKITHQKQQGKEKQPKQQGKEKINVDNNPDVISLIPALQCENEHDPICRNGQLPWIIGDYLPDLDSLKNPNFVVLHGNGPFNVQIDLPDRRYLEIEHFGQVDISQLIMSFQMDEKEFRLRPSRLVKTAPFTYIIE